MTTDTDGATGQAAIARLYDTWVEAAKRQDIDTIVSLYTDDIRAFDAILALQLKGRDAYRKHWQACMEICPMNDKTLVFEMHELTVQAEGDTAFAHALMRCGVQEGEKIEASWMRMSAGLRRLEDEWKIAHEHFSAPFEMPSGKAMFHLSPDADAHAVRPIPEGMSTVSPHLVCADARAAIDFYKKAFNATDMAGGPLEIEGVFLHGEIIIGDSVVMIGQEDAGCGSLSPSSLKGTAVTLHLYVPDVDHAFKRALAAGAKEIMPVGDMFWGDRYGMLEDPFGHRWSLATHVRDVALEEIRNAAREFCAQAAK